MRTASRAAVLGGTALVGLVLGGLSLPRTAHAIRSYVCESPIDGYCEATRDTGVIECSCRGMTVELDRPDIFDVSDEELADACWSAYSEVCNDEGTTVQCEAEDRGQCEATTAEGGRIECECLDGRTEHLLDASELEELDENGLEDACHEQLDTLCEPLPPTTPVMAPPAEPFDTARGSTGCRVSEPQGGLLALGLLVLGVFRRRRFL
jgi:MYXO-CTERM domain-containing protein